MATGCWWYQMLLPKSRSKRAWPITRVLFFSFFSTTKEERANMYIQCSFPRLISSTAIDDCTLPLRAVLVVAGFFVLDHSEVSHHFRQDCMVGIWLRGELSPKALRVQVEPKRGLYLGIQRDSRYRSYRAETIFQGEVSKSVSAFEK